MEARAHRVGDILTVSLLKASRPPNPRMRRVLKQVKQCNPTYSNGRDTTKFLGNSAELGSSGESTFSGSGSTNQSNSLTGLISVHVVRVYANGNLEILVRKADLNNGDEYIRVSGIVRPRDITSDNVVQSDRLQMRILIMLVPAILQELVGRVVYENA